MSAGHAVVSLVSNAPHPELWRGEEMRVGEVDVDEEVILDLFRRLKYAS